VARPGTSVTADELGAFCRERLAKYKVPVHINFVEALPHTAAGKLQRRLLRDREPDARAP
jgi:acyl-CoA synthetase (AMP-forming)/AMP-acid ligase II